MEAELRPGRKAHPAFETDDLDGLGARPARRGHASRADEPLEGWRRIYVDDSFGNRVELTRRA